MQLLKLLIYIKNIKNTIILPQKATYHLIYRYKVVPLHKIVICNHVKRKVIHEIQIIERAGFMLDPCV